LSRFQPGWSRSLARVALVCTSDLPRTYSFRIPRWRWRRPVSPAHRPTALPSSRTSKASTPKRVSAHFGRPKPSVESRSARGVSHPFDGFLRFALAGILHPAPDLGFATLHAVRTSAEAGGCTSAIPATPLPFEELPSQTSVSCHQARFLLVVPLRPRTAFGEGQCDAAVQVDPTCVGATSSRGKPRISCETLLSQNPQNFRRSPGASTSRLCSVCESVSLGPVARTLTTCPFHGFDLKSRRPLAECPPRGTLSRWDPSPGIPQFPPDRSGFRCHS